MLAALNLGAVLVGLAAGGLSATLVGLILGVGLRVAGVETGPDIGLVVGILAGLVTAGWVAGSFARHSSRFHGAVTGLLFAGILTVLARLGGGQAPPLEVLWLSVLSAVVAGLSGWVAGRRRVRRIGTASPSDGRGRQTEESPDSTGQGAG